MEQIILRQKWLGFMAAVLLSLFLAVRTASQLSDVYVAIEPSIGHEAEYFLPITIENGKIVSPRDAFIERVYGKYRLVLNTKVDDLDVSNLSSGIYVTRNKLYSYDDTKGEVKIQSLEKIPNASLTIGDVKEFLSKVGGYIKPVTIISVFFGLLIWIGIAVSLYTLVTHWLFKRLYKADYALTLRVNTLIYLVLSLFEFVAGAHLGIIVTLLIMLAGNYVANLLLKTEE